MGFSLPYGYIIIIIITDYYLTFGSCQGFFFSLRISFNAITLCKRPHRDLYMNEMFKLLLFMSEGLLGGVTKRVGKTQKGKLDEDGEIHGRQSLSTSLFCLCRTYLKKNSGD